MTAIYSDLGPVINRLYAISSICTNLRLEEEPSIALPVFPLDFLQMPCRLSYDLIIHFHL